MLKNKLLILFLSLVLLLFVLSVFFKEDKTPDTKAVDTKITSNTATVDSLKLEISKRDSLITDTDKTNAYLKKYYENKKTVIENEKIYYIYKNSVIADLDADSTVSLLSDNLNGR